MKSNTFWYGYLEAGEKGSLVVRDPNLDTGKPDTFYLYNLKRDAVLEYKASFVEPKLRELNDTDKDQLSTLKEASKKAFSQFQSRNDLPLNEVISPANTTNDKSKKSLDDFKTEETDDDFTLDETEN